MSKTTKPISPINEAFAGLVKSKGSQVEAAALLGISSQSVGYYMRGRKIPADVIMKVQEVYGVNLLTGKIETNISRETNRDALKHSFNTEVIKEAINQSMLEQLYKDLANFDKELDRAWALIDRLVPPTQNIKGITAKDR